jgi:hypothetical protein
MTTNSSIRKTTYTKLDPSNESGSSSGYFCSRQDNYEDIDGHKKSVCRHWVSILTIGVLVGTASMIYYATSSDSNFETTTYSAASPLLYECEYYDDDSVYPNDDCIYHDMGFCKTFCSQGTPCYDVCGSACVYDYDGTSYDNITTYGNPCLWQAVTNLELLCKNDLSFVHLPFQESLNIPPDEMDMTDNSISDPCAMHSYCVSCNSNNEYCAAVVTYYKDVATIVNTDSGELIDYSMLMMLDDLDTFWCLPEVLGSIKDGTFIDKYGDTLDASNEKYSRYTDVDKPPSPS